MLELFNEYKNAGKVREALLIGRNMVNKNPSDFELFQAYIDWLLFLAEELPALEDRRQFLSQANVTLAFFEENADITKDLIREISVYQDKIDALMQSIEVETAEREKAAIVEIQTKNDDLIKRLYQERQNLITVKTQDALDDELLKIKSLDEQIDSEYMTEEQMFHYTQISKKCTDDISDRMREIERKENQLYNKKAVEAYESAFRRFKSDENKYKNSQTQLFSLVSTTLFAYDAARLFNESLIYYNHIYSFIFGKLDDDGKFALTRFSIECERKKR